MLSHAEIADYLADLTDVELEAFATRVTAWRLLLQGGPYDATRRLVVRLLAHVSEAFAARGWSSKSSWGDILPPGSPWHRVHAGAALAATARAGTAPREIQREVARWAGTVRLQVA